jgi:hypothetical protein
VLNGLSSVLGVQKPLSTLVEGAVMEGEVVGHHLLHGCQVDVGVEFCGMTFINEQQWDTLSSMLPIGMMVRVRIHKVRTGSLSWTPGFVTCVVSTSHKDWGVCFL